jgi:hypothetical protein
MEEMDGPDLGARRDQRDPDRVDDDEGDECSELY